MELLTIIYRLHNVGRGGYMGKSVSLFFKVLGENYTVQIGSIRQALCSEPVKQKLLCFIYRNLGRIYMNST